MVLTYENGTRDFSGRTFLTARRGGKQAWVLLAWPGWSRDTWWTLPDGGELDEAVNTGDAASLPDGLYLATENTGAHGDMLWTGSMVAPIISRGFADVLHAIGATGYSLVPASVHPKRGEPIDGYAVVLLDNNDDDDVRPFPPDRRAVTTLDVSARVIEALRSAGVDGFDTEEPTTVLKQMEAIED